MKKISCLIGVFLLFTVITFALTPTQFVKAYNGVTPTSYQLKALTGQNGKYMISQNSSIQLCLLGNEILMVILDSNKMTPDELKKSISEFNTMANFVILATQSKTSMKKAQQIFKNLQNSKTGTLSINDITYVLSADQQVYNLEIDF